MRDELAGPNPSPLERMLAERVVLCFYQVEILSAHLMEMQRESISGAEPLSRQLDGAHRRHLSAVRTLAEVRRLQLPSVQVNIGEKQVNIGQLNAPSNGATPPSEALEK